MSQHRLQYIYIYVLHNGGGLGVVYEVDQIGKKSLYEILYHPQIK